MSFEQFSVLIVDDAATVRACLRQILTPLGFTTIQDAASGQRALALLKLHRFDLVFLDIELPDYDGCVLLTEIKKQTIGTHVVMCSSHNSFSNVQACIKGGASNFIIKPFSPLKINSIALHCLAKRRG
ncbi:response regulator [Alishewanella longhuensis]